MSNTALGYVILASWLICNGIAIGLHLSGQWAERPLIYRLAAVPFEIAAVWIALRMVGL